MTDASRVGCGVVEVWLWKLGGLGMKHSLVLRDRVIDERRRPSRLPSTAGTL
jgi:hypothetical protein